MKHWLIYTAIIVTSWLLPHQSFAQGVDVGITGVGILSIQPIDEAYVGSPYLSEGIGGAAPGFGAGVNVITPVGFVAAVEYSTARYELEQSGRLVAGEQIPATTQLHDSLLAGMGGFAFGSGKTRVVALGGIGVLLDDPTVNGDPREPEETNHDRGLAFVPTGGLDVLQSLNSRAAITGGVRYGFAERAENQRYLGVGRHIWRVGAGIRVRLGD